MTKLAFGTSGLRGLVRDITDLEAYVNVKGALAYLFSVGDVAAGSSVVVGGDLRPSTDRILAACVQAIGDLGCSVENAGKLPTPALMLHALETGRASVMVTGSHIPFDRNGIKINKRAGEVLKSDEPGILAAIERGRGEALAVAGGQLFGADAMLRVPAKVPNVNFDAEARYLARYLDCFAGALEGQRLVFYQHSAVGRDLVPRILRALGAEVVEAGRSETFVPIDTENITDEALALLASLARDAGGRVDAVLSTDGDSDRPLMTAVRADGSLRFLPGDLLGIVVAEQLHADAAAVPVSANDAVERRLGERGVTLQKTRIGSPYVIAALDELRRRAARAVGWEANGGFLLASDIPVGGGTLRALPTRDAVLPMVANLAAARGLGLDALWSRLPARFGRAGLIHAVPPEESRALLARLGGADAAARLERHFTRALGFGAVRHIDTLDGVRVYFANGDVAHLRPSGNAPQLRIYSNADTQERADQIVELALREPDGILRRLRSER